jgi:hypothetical protein
MDTAGGYVRQSRTGGAHLTAPNNQIPARRPRRAHSIGEARLYKKTIEEVNLPDRATLEAGETGQRRRPGPGEPGALVEREREESAG